MTRKVLQAAECCQMRRIVNGVDIGPSTGTGSGGDRCVEAVSAMIDLTYHLGPMTRDGKSTPEQVMYSFVRAWNGPGAINSNLENAGIKFGGWLHDNGYDKQVQLKNKTWPGFADIVECIDRGHVAIGGFNNYAALRLAAGGNPYKWTDPPGLGHVLLIVGYDLEKQIVVVHDPLRARPSGQPADYSWKSFQAAIFHDCTEVVGAVLPYSENTGGSASAPAPAPVTGGHMSVPAGWHDDGTTLTAPNGVKVVRGFRDYILAYPGGWNAANVPLAAETGYSTDGTRQDFAYSSRAWTPAKGQFDLPIGEELQAAKEQLKTASVDNATLQTELAKANVTIKALQASQSVPVPTIPAALDAALAQAFQAWQQVKATPKPAVTAPLPAQPN